MTCAQSAIRPLNLFALASLVRGDTWDGIRQMGPVLFNQAQPPLALAKVELHFRRSWDDFEPAYVLVSGTPPSGAGQIVIVDADTWFATAPPQPLPLAPGVWYWDAEFTDSAGGVFTPYGGSITIKQDNTHPNLFGA